MTISCGLSNSKVNQPPLGSPVGHTVLITTLICFLLMQLGAVLTDLPPSFTLNKKKKKLISTAATAALGIFG